MKTLLMWSVAAHLAMAGLANAQENPPTEALIYFNRGTASHEKKDYDKAITDFNEAIRLYPKYADAYFNRGYVWYMKHEYDKAIADYTEAIRFDHKNAAIYMARGAMLYFKKEHDRAIADYDRAIRLAPELADAYSNRGLVRHDRKEYGDAIADFNEAIRLDPMLGSPYELRAWLWATCPDERHRDGRRAVASATRACELSEWKEARDLNTLAASFAESDDFTKAVEWQEKANKLYTDAELRKKGEERLKLYKEMKPYRDVR